jgi:hypothetical protein
MNFEFALIGEIRVKPLPDLCLFVSILAGFEKQKRPGHEVGGVGVRGFVRER